MELTEPIESLNQQLVDLFGLDTVTGDAIWRIVWGPTQYETRKSDYSERGIFLLTPRIIEFPKYQYIGDKYILERLTIVPEQNRNELAGAKISYEPHFVFRGRGGTYLPPRIDVAKFVIDTTYAAMGKKSLAKYTDDSITPEAKEKRIQEIQEYLYGDETDVTDSLRYGSGVALPSKHYGEQ